MIALLSAYIRSMPITTSALYLALGLLVGPLGLGLIEINFIEQSELFEHLTEIAVIVALFLGGIKLRLPFRDPAWSAAYRLAGPVMVASICGIAVFAHFAFGFDWPISFLLGAVLAPTDPVLADLVSVNNASDRDRMRYGLSGEAGFNDGAAFPFVIFALTWLEFDRLGGWIGTWALHRLAWAVPAGLLLGYFLGRWVGRLAIWLRARHEDTEAPNDFLALSLIALAYTGAEVIGAWGFLAVFAAGLGFRATEIKLMQENPLPDDERSGNGRSGADEPDGPQPGLPAEEIAEKIHKEEAIRNPATAGGVVITEIISFGGTAERLAEVLIVIIVGICVANYWDWRAIPLALALFFVIRPLAAYIFLAGSPTGKYQRLMMAWFGIRGIGSLYYLSYALNHGLAVNLNEMVGLTISVIALSIFLHGITSQPALDLYERKVLENEK